jgi:ribosomal protein S18 acetylase RimI-like enzyme
MKYRLGAASDVDAVAALHADSWRRNYRGAYSDAYLDGDVFADRLAVWTERLTHPRENEFAIVAERDGEVVGFAYVVLDEHPEWGALVDNLHVAHAAKRSGVGSRLIAECARAVIERRPATGLHLTVLEQNTSAQAFYEARGGTCVERMVEGPFPGGRHAGVLRYAWPDPATLLDGV